MTDPIADMLTRMRNAHMVQTTQVTMPHSKMKEAVLSVLKTEGYIVSFEIVESKPQNVLKVTLKYVENEPAMSRLDRVSKPGRRVYIKAKYIKPTLNGYGMSVISTSHGVMTDTQAREQGLGGEVICKVW